MIQAGFRILDVEARDFPITLTASTDANQLPSLAPVAFWIQDVLSGNVSAWTASFKDNGGQTATVTITVPQIPSNLVFAVQVRFPAGNPADKPLKLQFAAIDNQKALDKIPPDVVPVVFANYVMHFR